MDAGPRRGPRRDRAGAPSGSRPARRTVLFLDEIHRFNKAQQDALLPAVEDGLVTLIGATTENPYFEVNSALLSRTRVYELGARAPRRCGAAATARSASASAAPPAAVDEDALEFLAARAGGDARTALDALELACEPPVDGETVDARPRRGRAAEAGGPLRQGRATATTTHIGLDQGHPRLRPRRIAVLPGRDARGRRGPALHRPPDGDPRLRGRRQRRPAGARRGDRRSRAVEHVGLPECQFALAQAAIYLALAPKSNAAKARVRRRGATSAATAPPQPPAHLRSRPAAAAATATRIAGRARSRRGPDARGGRRALLRADMPRRRCARAGRGPPGGRRAARW